MENEQPARRERQTLDVFDPTGDGHQPHTLAEVLAAGQDLLDSFDKFQAALYGCMTPLAFHTEARIAGTLRDQAAEILEPIRKARDIIELDLPLATMESFTFPFGEGWASPEASSVSLSPENILDVRLRSRQVGPEELTTYRQEMEKVPKVPSLIRRQRMKAKRDAAQAAMTDQDRADVEARKADRIAARRAARLSRSQKVQLLDDEFAAEIERAWQGTAEDGPADAGPSTND